MPERIAKDVGAHLDLNTVKAERGASLYEYIK